MQTRDSAVDSSKPHEIYGDKFAGFFKIPSCSPGSAPNPVRPMIEMLSAGADKLCRFYVSLSDSCIGLLTSIVECP